MALSALGPFFALQAASEGGGWRSLRELCEGPALDERAGHVADVLGRMAGTAIEPRVAASTMSLGLFARLVAPVLGASVLGLRIPPLDLDLTLWRPTAGGPWPLALTGGDAEPDLVRALEKVVLPLADVVAARSSLSPRIARGNAASAVFGAARMVGVARAELAEPALALGRAALDGPLAGTGEVRETFVRSSCCLYYRVPGGGYCGDCVLTRRR